ncbi:QWRF motif-containing protein 7-like [Telopea speciosissima]|uniref:QWRF motif-containing protein 7-like n=1 Tax=Telopea speciosissima TaxID=54955 RepID=UPI001CC6B6E8|nr:QWRF motif-containing protein 7-like [Telopea speciosissima]
MPDTPPFRSNSGRKSVDRPNFTTRTRTNHSTGGEENRNPSSTKIPIPGISKKPQEKLISSSVPNLQRHRNPNVFKTNEKLKTKKTGSVTPSAWALSPGRTSSNVIKAIDKLKTKQTASVTPSAWALSSGRTSSIFPVSKSPANSCRTTQRTRSVSSVLYRSRQNKVSSVQDEALHQLRVMHTRLLQWRFVNARSESILAAKKNLAEKKILKVWSRIIHLRNSILEKRLQIQKLKNDIKIIRIINPQIRILNQWEEIEKKNSEAVARIGRKLLASVTGIPLTDAAKADTDSVQNAMLTAMGVMDSIEATITKFISQVQEIDSLAYELVNTEEQARKGLEELRKEIAIVASLEVGLNVTVTGEKPWGTMSFKQQRREKKKLFVILCLVQEG